MIRGAITCIWSAALLLAALPVSAQESHTIRFRALTPDGAPVINAPVHWMPYKDELRTAFPGEHERSVTDTEGYCTVDFSTHPDAAGSNFEVCVEPGEGYAGFLRVYPPRKTEDPAVITVEKQVPIRGRVRTESGEPVAGAVMGSPWFPRTTTDENGQFTVWGLGTGGTLSIFKEGFAWTTMDSARGEVDIALQTGFRVTFEATDADGTPLPGATIRYRDIATKTGEDGRAVSLPLPRDEDFHVQAWQEGGATYLSAETQQVSVTGEAPQVVKLVLKRQEETPTVSISGRVVMTDTGEAVRARIYINNSAQEFDYFGRSRAETAKDGSFTLANLPCGEHYIQVRPTKSTLYGSDGIVRVDCRAGSVEGLELKVAPGFAVSGRIALSDGSEPEPQWVILRHGSAILQSYSERGLFQFFNLPPSPSSATLEAGGETLPIALGEVGTALRGVTLTLAGPSDRARIAGRIVNAQGEPQAGLSLTIRIKGSGEPAQPATSGERRSDRIEAGRGRDAYANGETDGEGRFAIETEHTGTASIERITTTRQFSVGGETERRGFDCRIFEGPEYFAVEVGAKSADLRYVVEVPELVTVAGTIRDEAGNPLEPRVSLLTAKRESDSPMGQVHGGQFLFHSLPEEKFAMEFTLEKYQVRILEEGRDFTRGDQEIQVVLPSTPYPEDVKLWTTITGAPWTQEAVDQAIQGQTIRLRFDQYQRLLNPPPRPAAQSVQPESPAAAMIPVLVVDASGNPVTRVTVHRAEFYGYPEPERTPEPIDAFLKPQSAATILSNPEGHFEVPPGHLIWAEGTCRQLTGRPLAEGDISPRIITLYPARRLTVRVKYPDGTPAPDISLAPYRGYLNPSAMSPIYAFPRTGDSGILIYDGLPPERYTLIAHRNNGDPYTRLLQADLTGGGDLSLDMEFAPYAEGSADALLEQLQVAWRSVRNESPAPSLKALWEAVPREDRERIVEAVQARLAQPVLADIEALPFLAELAVVLELKAAVPDLLRHAPYLPEQLNYAGAPAIANATADLAGNGALDHFMKSAADASLDHRSRMVMIAAMNRIGTPESLAAWQTLRGQARTLPNAPQAKAEYTHQERMEEAMALTLGYVAGALPEQPLRAHSAEVDEDYATGRLWMQNTEYTLRRYGDEWVPVEIGNTIME